MVMIEKNEKFTPLPPTYDERVIDPVHANIVYPFVVKKLSERGFRISHSVSTTFLGDHGDQRRFDSRKQPIGAQNSAVILSSEPDALSVFDMTINTFDEFLLINPNLGKPNLSPLERGLVEAELGRTVEVAVMIHNHDELREAA